MREDRVMLPGKREEKGTCHLMDDIRKHGGYMFTKPILSKVTEIPAVNRRRAAPARQNTRTALMPCSSGRAGFCCMRVIRTN
ncbi:MAG: hypothetical protein WA130_13060 [Candidatus Methanoperedens sp.]